VLTKGRFPPDPTGKTPPLHAIKKWRWWMLKVGIPA
jgi:hypothetical protein